MKSSKYLVAGLVLSAAMTVPTVLGTTSVYAATTQTQAAQQATIEIPIDTVERGPAGTRVVLTTKSVENGSYLVTVTSKNQSSVHPDSNLYVMSGDSVVKVADVERKAGGEITGNGTLNVSDGTVVVELELGPDKVFSGGLTVTLESKPQPPIEEPPVEAPEVPEVPVEEEPQVQGTTDEKTPVELPKTGVGSLFAGVAGIGSIAYAGQMYRTSVSRLRNGN